MKGSFELNNTGQSETKSSGGELKDVGIGDSMGSSTKYLSQLDAENARKGGIGFGMSAFFLVAQMAGAGFLALPRAVADAGWSGYGLIVIFCLSVALAAVRLGNCWDILEERWFEYRGPARQPFMDIAYRSLGVHGRRCALVSLLITLIGSTIVYIILIAEMMQNLVPAVSQCEWTLIVSMIILPMTFPGSPKDFWQASVLAVVSTLIAILVVVVKILIDQKGISDAPPTFPNPSITSFSLGFGAIMFAFGGSAVFPTVQNDMRDRTHFWKSVILSFAAILAMYLPVAIVGYIIIGNEVRSNVLLSVNPGIAVIIAIAMQIVNLLGTYVIAFNPVVQCLEDMMGIPSSFGWKRVALRSSVVVFELLVAFAIPDFGLILNLIGGSTMSLLTFILPPLMYMKLVDDKSNKEWPERNIPKWERICLWLIVIAGVVGGISATVSALMAILSPESFKKSCFVNFLGDNN